MFTYCLNNPIIRNDASGEKPGDLFNTIDEAARDFAFYTNGQSISENREYATYIYSVEVTDAPLLILFLLNLIGADELVDEMVETQFTYVEPQRGTQTRSCVPINWFGIHNVVAAAHTHSAYSCIEGFTPEFNLYRAELFSPADKAYADRNGIPIYVATPLGLLRRYNPKDSSDITLYDDIPYDPNHPLR